MASSAGASRSRHRSRGSSGRTDLAASVRDRADLEAAVMRQVWERVRLITSGDAPRPLGHAELDQIIHRVVMQQLWRIRRQRRPIWRPPSTEEEVADLEATSPVEEVADLEAPSTVEEVADLEAPSTEEEVTDLEAPSTEKKM